jgi:hypothetical protein
MGEAGANPALSRNCDAREGIDPLARQPGYPSQVRHVPVASIGGRHFFPAHWLVSLKEAWEFAQVNTTFWWFSRANLRFGPQSCGPFSCASEELQ